MLCKYVLHGKNTSVNNIFVYYLYNYVKLSNDASAFNLDSCKECFVNALLVHCCEYVIDQNFLGTHSSVFVFAMKDTKTWFCNLVPIDPTSVYESISKNVGICMHKLYHFHSLKLLPSWHGGLFFACLRWEHVVPTFPIENCQSPQKISMGGVRVQFHFFIAFCNVKIYRDRKHLKEMKIVVEPHQIAFHPSRYSYAFPRLSSTYVYIYIVLHNHYPKENSRKYY